MTLTGIVIRNIIRKLLIGQDYRSEIVTLLDAEFLQYVVGFFKRVACAKLDNKDITVDWYKKEFLSPDLFSPQEVAIHSGLNKKTITNMYNSGRKQIVLDASVEHYDALYDTINSLTEQDSIDVSLTIRFRDVSVDLNINESMIVINTLAVKRSAISGGLWSTAGKQVEKPLMATLCALFQVPQKYYDQGNLPESQRESDFYLFNETEEGFPCEVKLMGKGNPESADAVYARGSRVLVANTLSDLNKEQMDTNGIFWVELKKTDDYKRFEQVLNGLSIPYKSFTGDLQVALDKILPAVIISDEVQDSVTPEAVLREREQDDDSSPQLLVEFE